MTWYFSSKIRVTDWLVEPNLECMGNISEPDFLKTWPSREMPEVTSPAPGRPTYREVLQKNVHQLSPEHLDNVRISPKKPRGSVSDVPFMAPIFTNLKLAKGVTGGGGASNLYYTQDRVLLLLYSFYYRYGSLPWLGEDSVTAIGRGRRILEEYIYYFLVK